MALGRSNKIALGNHIRDALYNSHDIFVDGRWPALVILDPTHKPLVDALIENKDNLRSNLCTKENRFLQAMASTWCRGTARTSRGARIVPSPASTRRIAATVLFPFREILWGLQGLDGCGRLRVPCRAIMQPSALIHTWCSRVSIRDSRVISMGCSDKERIDTMATRIMRKSWLTNGRGCVGSACWKGCGETRGNLGGKHGGGR